MKMHFKSIYQFNWSLGYRQKFMGKKIITYIPITLSRVCVKIVRISERNLELIRKGYIVFNK